MRGAQLVSQGTHGSGVGARPVPSSAKKGAGFRYGGQCDRQRPASRHPRCQDFDVMRTHDEDFLPMPPFRSLELAGNRHRAYAPSPSVAMALSPNWANVETLSNFPDHAYARRNLSASAESQGGLQSAESKQPASLLISCQQGPKDCTPNHWTSRPCLSRSV